jgi:hypothetical protein
VQQDHRVQLVILDLVDLVEQQAMLEQLVHKDLRAMLDQLVQVDRAEQVLIKV